jgi:ribosomal protein S18 acetylase RimI-like enzyme
MAALKRAFFQEYVDRPAGVRFRPITQADEAFLRELYGSVRAAELARVNWSDEVKRKFIADQFALQHKHYTNVYAGADFLLIEKDNAPIGRIYVYRSPREIQLMEISLIAELRGQGIGTTLLHELIDEARASDCELTLHVELDNPAQRLYQRLGFRLIENRGIYDFLGWRAS